MSDPPTRPGNSQNTTTGNWSHSGSRGPLST